MNAGDATVITISLAASLIPWLRLVLSAVSFLLTGWMVFLMLRLAEIHTDLLRLSSLSADLTSYRAITVLWESLLSGSQVWT